MALGNSAYVNSFVNFAVDSDAALKKAGCTPVTSINVADELKNQDESFSEWEKKIYGDSSSLFYPKDTSSRVSFDASVSTGEVREKMKLTLVGTAPLTKDAKAIGGELDRILQNHYKDSWHSHAGTLLHSMDLFSFKAKGNSTYEYLYSGAVQAGDHVGECRTMSIIITHAHVILYLILSTLFVKSLFSALYPKNQDDTVEGCVRQCIIDDPSKIDEYRKKLEGEVDLVRPLTLSSIHKLLDLCQHKRGKAVLRLYIENSDPSSDDPSSTTNTNPSIDSIIHSMPPGSVPLHWVFEQCPAMMPRFFSIVSANTSLPLALHSRYTLMYLNTNQMHITYSFSHHSHRSMEMKSPLRRVHSTFLTMARLERHLSGFVS